MGFLPILSLIWRYNPNTLSDHAHKKEGVASRVDFLAETLSFALICYVTKKTDLSFEFRRE
jgi:hypothetical protein